MVRVYIIKALVEFNFNQSFGHGANDAFKISQIYLRFNLSLEIDSGVQCGVGLTVQIILQVSWQ
jgi:hypothetical protein